MTVVRAGTGLDEDVAVGLWQAAQAGLGRRNGGTRAQRVRTALRSRDALLLVAEQDGEPVGILLAALVRQTGTVGLEVTHLAVEPPAQRSGVGRSLLSALTARYPAVSVWVQVDDDAALGLFRADGFVGSGRVEDRPAGPFVHLQRPAG